MIRSCSRKLQRQFIYKDYRSNWFTRDKFKFKQYVCEDRLIISFLKKYFQQSVNVYDFYIFRKNLRLSIYIFSGRPAEVIGNKADIINLLIEKIRSITSSYVYIFVKKFYKPNYVTAMLVSNNICSLIMQNMKIHRYMSFLKNVIKKNYLILGATVIISGLLRNSSKKKRSSYKLGIIRSKTLKHFIDEYVINLRTRSSGIFGIKVFITYSEGFNKFLTYNFSLKKRT